MKSGRTKSVKGCEKSYSQPSRVRFAEVIEQEAEAKVIRRLYRSLKRVRRPEFFRATLRTLVK